MPNLKFMIAVALIALASTTPMFAAVTHSGAAQKAIVVVTETNDQFTSSTSYSDLVGAAAVITVPAGKNYLVTARFTAESYCFGLTYFTWCTVQILADGTPMLPDVGFDFAFDATGNADDAWEGHTVDRSMVLGPGVHTIKVQWAVTDPAEIFRLDDWSLTVSSYANGH